MAEQLQETDIRSFGLVAGTIDDMKVLSPPDNDEEPRFQVNGIWAAAQHMGEALKDEFETKIQTDAGWQAIGDLIWWSSAQGCLRRSGFAAPAFWDLLARIQDSRHLAHHLPEVVRKHSRPAESTKAFSPSRLNSYRTVPKTPGSMPTIVGSWLRPSLRSRSTRRTCPSRERRTRRLSPSRWR